MNQLNIFGIRLSIDWKEEYVPGNEELYNIVCAVNEAIYQAGLNGQPSIMLDSIDELSCDIAWLSDDEQDEGEYLIGGWEMVKGKYQPVNEEGFSAIVQWLGGAPIVTVVAGIYYTTVRSMCSPCCPGQADLDSGYQEGGYACYSLPGEFYREEE